MDELRRLLANNREWAARVTAADPDFFTSRSREQTPRYLWVGCSDSRVPSDTVVGLNPGDLFVHRNIGNLVVHGWVYDIHTGLLNDLGATVDSLEGIPPVYRLGD